jgi:gluconate 2-dehydrogenase gamma chain
MTSRRDFVRSIALLATLGGWIETLGAASPDAVDVATGCRRALTPEQHELVATLAELIIPTTDTPGARTAGVHLYIDRMITRTFTCRERAAFVRGLDDVESRALERGHSFVASPPEVRVEILRQLVAVAAETRTASNGDRPFFDVLRELTLVGYYTSEIGATQELRYMHAAGTYDGDVAFETIGRAYS